MVTRACVISSRCVALLSCAHSYAWEDRARIFTHRARTENIPQALYVERARSDGLAIRATRAEDKWSVGASLLAGAVREAEAEAARADEWATRAALLAGASGGAGGGAAAGSVPSDLDAALRKGRERQAAAEAEAAALAEKLVRALERSRLKQRHADAEIARLRAAARSSLAVAPPATPPAGDESGGGAAQPRGQAVPRVARGGAGVSAAGADGPDSNGGVILSWLFGRSV